MPNRLQDATIVFDLDGTLVDTAEDILRALNRVLADHDLAPAPHLRGLVGRGARVLIERASGAQGRTFPPEQLDRLTEVFVSYYAREIATSSAPFPGVVEALDAFAAAGARLSVCTNKRTGLSVQLLEALGLAGRFGAIVGADSVSERKPSPIHYRTAVTLVGGDVTRSVMVGDSSADVGAAKAAGAPCIVYRFGYADEDVERLGADILIDHFNELPQAARRLLPPL